MARTVNRVGDPGWACRKHQRSSVMIAILGLLMAMGTLAGCSDLGRDLTSSATTPADPPSAEGLISLAEAKDRVDRFDAASGGGGTDELNGSLERGSYGGRNFAVFNLETAGGERSFKVDARTGEVLEASWSDRLA